MRHKFVFPAAMTLAALAAALAFAFAGIASKGTGDGDAGFSAAASGVAAFITALLAGTTILVAGWEWGATQFGSQKGGR